MTVIAFSKVQEIPFIQIAFKCHERRTLGDIRTRLVEIGFSKDPRFNAEAFPDKSGVSNRLLLDIDVADTYYQRIFGESFVVSITKYKKDDKDFFQMETPISKSSGAFSDVIMFVENFINTNLKPEHKPVHGMVARV